MCLHDQCLQSFLVMLHFHSSSTGLGGRLSLHCGVDILSSFKFPWMACSSLWMCKRNLVLSLTDQIKSRALYPKVLECPCKQVGFPFITSTSWQRVISLQTRVVLSSHAAVQWASQSSGKSTQLPNNCKFCRTTCELMAGPAPDQRTPEFQRSLTQWSRWELQYKGNSGKIRYYVDARNILSSLYVGCLSLNLLL